MSVATYTLSLLSSLAPDVDEGGGNCLAAGMALTLGVYKKLEIKNKIDCLNKAQRLGILD